jgi:hypothetical protein
MDGMATRTAKVEEQPLAVRVETGVGHSRRKPKAAHQIRKKQNTK